METLRLINLINGKVVEVPMDVVRHVISIELYPYFYWRYNHYHDVVYIFFANHMDEDALPRDVVKRIKEYVLFYAENLVFTMIVHLMSIGEDWKEYMELNMELIEKLREMYRDETKRVWDMVELCLEYGIDPF